jgi:hypothetical protein
MFWDTLFVVKVMQLFFEKNGSDYILGDFFTNTSGHPAQDLRFVSVNARKAKIN